MCKQWKQWQTLFFWAPKSLQMVTAAMKLRDAYSLEGSYDQPREHIKKQRHHFADNGSYSQSYRFPDSSDGKESACNARDLGLIPREGNGNPLQYSYLENSMNGPWDRKKSDTAE